MTGRILLGVTLVVCVIVFLGVLAGPFLFGAS